jgi:hypothetical protein
MVWSIDPRRETLRVIQWWLNANIALLFGTRVAETILAAVVCGRINRPDI